MRRGARLRSIRPTRCSPRRSSAPRSSRAYRLDEISTYINETALYRNQWQFRPINTVDGAGHEAMETDAEFKERVRPLLREQLALAKAGRPAGAPARLRLLPGQQPTATSWSCGRTSRARASACASATPANRRHPYLCIADFFRPVESGEADYAAFHIVTMGERISERPRQLFAENRYQDYLLLHGLGVEMTEALAEYWHRRIREEWGFADEDGPRWPACSASSSAAGATSWGYPACPDLEDNAKVAELLDAARSGIEVSEDTGWQYQPEQTTSAIICHHPQAKYFVAR